MTKLFLPKLKTLVNTKTQWEAFNELLEHNIGLHQKKLEQAVDMADIYKAQGAIQVLRQLKFLRDEVNAEK